VWVVTEIVVDHETVKKFHEAAVAAGGKCNGPPGIRETYHPNYYGAVSISTSDPKIRSLTAGLVRH
jgi:lactoylglutathione lyase